MTKAEVMDLLEANRNERGVKNWDKLGFETKGLKSFGIGLTQLRKLAKKIGRDNKLASQLWKSDNHDAKVIGLLIDEPKKMTREQAEAQVEEVDVGSLAHVFSSCDATLAKAPFVFDLACDWIANKDPVRRQCGYGLIYELSKNLRMKELSDKFFFECIEGIRERFSQEDMWGSMSMGNALMGIGKRNRELNQAALKLAVELGPIAFDNGSGACEPFDVAKHLTSDYLKNKLGL
ncbi:MAG: DNA alkylation repair protein [Luteolibacter sp.]